MGASNSSKRKRKITDYFSADPTKIKKRKLNAKPARVLFMRGPVYARFQSIYGSVMRSALVSALSVPSDVVQEIAEYGTGNVEKCGIPHCRHKIRLFEQDGASSDHYEFDEELNVFYCSDCFRNHNLLRFCQPCERWIYVREQGIECGSSNCDVFVHDCDQSEWSNQNAFECASCRKTFCSQCKSECQNCAQSFCWKCDSGIFWSRYWAPEAAEIETAKRICGGCQLSLHVSSEEDCDL